MIKVPFDAATGCLIAKIASYLSSTTSKGQGYQFDKRPDVLSCSDHARTRFDAITYRKHTHIAQFFMLLTFIVSVKYSPVLCTSCKRYRMLPRETSEEIHNGRGQTLIIESVTGANSHTKTSS